MRSVLLVVNPASRHGNAGADEALDAFHDLGVRCEVALTDAAGHAAEITKARSGLHDAVFTFGGDGTAMEAIGALVGTDRPIGILPGGTGNQLARHLGTPLHVGRAVRSLVAGGSARIDLGRLASGRRFALTSGIGIDAAMLAGATASAKRRFGFGAYLWSGFRAIVSAERHAVVATVDGVRYERECGLAMIANIGALFGGLLPLGPSVRTDDGLLDLCLFSANSAAEALDDVRRCMMRDFRPHPRLLFVPGREITIETARPTAVQADGELLDATPLHAVAEPLAARLLTPVS